MTQPQPPQGPPPPPQGPPPPAAGGRRLVALLVAAALVVALLAVGGLVWALSGGDADSVQEVADQAVEAAEDLDVDAGIDLLCEAPSREQREELDELIAEGREEAGTDDPDVDYAVSRVEGDAEGSFVVHISSDEAGLSDRSATITVLVESRDGRSCIAGVAEDDNDD